MAIKIAAERFDAVAIAAVRVGIAAACLVLFCFLKRETFYPKAGLLIRLVSIAIFGQIVPFVCLGIGGALASSGGLAVMMGFAPLATLLIGRLCVSGENWTTTKWIALLVGFSGLSLSVNGSISEWRTILETPTAELQGRLYALVAAVGYAFGAVMAKRVSEDIPPRDLRFHDACFNGDSLEASQSPPEPRLTRAMNGPGSRLSVSEWSIPPSPMALLPTYRVRGRDLRLSQQLSRSIGRFAGGIRHPGRTVRHGHDGWSCPGPFRHIAVLPLGERAGVEGARRNRAPAVTAQ